MLSNQFISLPGRGNTYFYFTKMGRDGFSAEQISFIAGLIRSYRERFPRLEIAVVQDFGMEEGAKRSGKKYGDFAACRDNAVFNTELMSISYNHIRVSKMPMDIPRQELEEILRRYEMVKEISAKAAKVRERLMSEGSPPARIAAAVKEMADGILCFEPGPHNGLPLEDPLFPDVWAIRQLEESMSIRRLTVHELGHAISQIYGILGLKSTKKLFAKCRDGFEDLDEFCAECFMAAELTDRIGLANEFSAVMGGQL